MSKYDEIMDRVHVTDDMRNRVLGGVEQYFERERQRKKRRHFYTAGAAAAAVVLVVSFAALRNAGIGSIGIPGGGIGETELAAGGFYVTDCASAEELESIVGFSVPVLSKLPFDVKDTAYTAIGGELAQIIYYGEDGDTELILRKSPGTEDNSGDYSSYADEAALDINGIAVSLRGNGGLYFLACWQDTEYAYSLSCSTGCDEDTFRALAAEVMGDQSRGG